jgi:tetratricopeptide (TPR) repeat protein
MPRTARAFVGGMCKHVLNRGNRREPEFRKRSDCDAFVKICYVPFSFPKDHPNVARVLNNLALLLQDTNRQAEAEPLLRRALAIAEQSYGKDHPDVATHLINLALLLQATNRLAEAEPLMRRALAIVEESYGKDHPIVAIRLNDLAMLLQVTNRLADAEPLMRRALEIWIEFTRRTRHKHPHLDAGQENYRGLLEALGQTPHQIEQRLRELDKSLHPDES